MKIKNILVVYKKGVLPVVKVIEKTLKKHNVNYLIKERRNVKEAKCQMCDLVIIVGGDGTFLTISHFVTGKTKIMAVNADPKHSFGFFTRANKNDFDRKFKNILKGKCTIKKLSRIEVEVNGKKPLHLATNDIYFGHYRPHGVARYSIAVNGKKSTQLSSGLIVATPYGSYGWARSLGVTPLKKSDNKLLFVVREPIINNFFDAKIRTGTVAPSKKIELICKRGDAMIGIDGFGEDEVRLKNNDKIKIYQSKDKLLFIEKC